MVTHGSSRVAHLKPHDRNIGLSLGQSTIISPWGHRSFSDRFLKFPSIVWLVVQARKDPGTTSPFSC